MGRKRRGSKRGKEEQKKDGERIGQRRGDEEGEEGSWWEKGGPWGGVCLDKNLGWLTVCPL